MKQQVIFTALFLFFFGAVPFAQENKALQFTKKDNNNNVQNKVFVIPQDEDVIPHLEKADFPKDVEEKIKQQLKDNYENGESFAFVVQDDGEEYRFEIIADAEKMDNSGRKELILRKVRERIRDHHPKEGGPHMSYATIKANQHAYLGVKVKAYEHRATNSSIRGVEVEEVVEGEAAYNAGVQVGDIITMVNDLKTPSPSLFKDAVSQLKPREEVTFTLSRDGNTKTMTALTGKKRGFLFWQGNEDRPFRARSFDFDFEGLRPNKAQLGVVITENEKGVTITNVSENSAADKAGIKKGDIITEIDGNKMESTEDVVEYLADKEARDIVKVKVKRGNKTKSMKVSLEEGRDFMFHMPQDIEIEEMFDESKLEQQFRQMESQLNELLPNLEQRFEKLQPQIEQQIKNLEPMIEKQLKNIEVQMNTI